MKLISIVGIMSILMISCYGPRKVNGKKVYKHKPSKSSVKTTSEL